MDSNLKNKISLAMEDKRIKDIINMEEFYFQKGLDKFNEFKNFNPIAPSIYNKIIDDVNRLKKSNNFNNETYMNTFNKDSDEYRLLLLIMQLVSYIDAKASGKNKYNLYPDRRTMFGGGAVRQNDWVINLIKYKQDKNMDEIASCVRNAIEYIENPDKNTNMLSESHRDLTLSLLFNINTTYEKNFSKIVFSEMGEIDIKLKNEKNRGKVYEGILYSGVIKKIWLPNINIWKVSHGYFNNTKREEFYDRKIIVVHEDTGKEQGDKFINEMKQGDYFFLCYRSELRLIGRITSDASKMASEEKPSFMREYELLFECSNNKPYIGQKKGWSPNYNSTFWKVKPVDYGLFENELLRPYFNIILDDMIDAEEKPVEIIVEPEVKLQNNHNVPINRIYYGPPGTGKTYSVFKKAVEIIEPNNLLDIRKEMLDKFKSFKKDKHIEFCTFHQSYSYEEFIEGFRYDKAARVPVVKDGIFKQMCIKAAFEGLKNSNKNLAYNEMKDQLKENYNQNGKFDFSNAKNYVFIIDEINRGNISKIFGEIITLIEEDKRLCGENEIVITLPYSQEDFAIPPNLFIIGTMNTADRSIALMDIALRRRFYFEEIIPDANKIKTVLEGNGVSESLINLVTSVFNMLNRRIEVLLDRDHQIGHSYFLKIKNEKDIVSVWNYEIIPLLKEYFYNDWDKLELLLGSDNYESGFIYSRVNDENYKNLFGKKGNEYLEDEYPKEIKIINDEEELVDRLRKCFCIHGEVNEA